MSEEPKRIPSKPMNCRQRARRNAKDIEPTEVNDKRTVCIKFMEIIDEWCEEWGFEIDAAKGHELAQQLWDSLQMEVDFQDKEIVTITKTDVEDAIALGVIDNVPESMKGDIQDEG